MLVKCPGCAGKLNLGDELFAEKVVVRCPECLQIFVAHSQDLVQEGEASGEATLLASDKPARKKPLWQNESPTLSVIRGPEQGIHLRIKKDEMVVGREDADLILSDPLVSRWHCRIFREKTRYYLEDLGSTNGTLVNKRKIQRAELNHLDEIELGQTLIVYSERGEKQEQLAEDLSAELGALRDETRAKKPAEEQRMPWGREFYLEIMSSKDKARSFPIIQPLLILGRGEEANLKLEDEEASRKHAMIEILSRDNVFITDLASANGTFLNGVRIRSTRLKHNDILRLGQTVLKFIIKDVP